MRNFGMTRVIVIDECSFACADEIAKMDEKLRILKNEPKQRFGGVAIVFAGDMRQLEPVGKRPLYAQRSDRFEWFNVYIELDGKHRFKKDPDWGNLLLRFRNGEVTKEDIDNINSRKVCHGDILPDGIQYATHRNRTRDVINTVLFQKYCRDNVLGNGIVDGAVLILSDCLMRKTSDKTYTAMNAKQIFYNELSENDLQPGQQKPRVDPVLKLHRDCPMMMTHNQDVDAGIANGTCATLDQIVLHPMESATLVEVQVGISVKAYYASQVAALRLRHQSQSFNPRVFEIKSDEYAVKAQWPVVRGVNEIMSSNINAVEEVPMKIHQFAVVRNAGTTGHKLQGKSVSNIMVTEWDYSNNWAYVVLSRVREMKGLYLRTALKSDLSLYDVPTEYTNWINAMKNKESLYPSKDVYEEIANLSSQQHHRLDYI